VCILKVFLIFTILIRHRYITYCQNISCINSIDYKFQSIIYVLLYIRLIIAPTMHSITTSIIPSVLLKLDPSKIIINLVGPLYDWYWFKWGWIWPPSIGSLDVFNSPHLQSSSMVHPLPYLDPLGGLGKVSLCNSSYLSW